MGATVFPPDEPVFQFGIANAASVGPMLHLYRSLRTPFSSLFSVSPNVLFCADNTYRIGYVNERECGLAHEHRLKFTKETIANKRSGPLASVNTHLTLHP